MNKLIRKVRQRVEVETTRTDHCYLDAPPINRKLSTEEINHFEIQINRPLPLFLKSLYMEVGNGGYGPGYGFIELTDSLNTDEPSALELYKSFISDLPDGESWPWAFWKWPEELVPIIDWGCAIYSCIDCNTGEVYFSDPNVEVNKMEDFFTLQSLNLETLLEKWCDGINLWNEISKE